MNSLLFGVLSVALALASCDNKDIPGVENSNNVVAGLPTTARIAVSQSSPGTRAPEGTGDATQSEMQLGAVTLYVFAEGSLADIRQISAGSTSITFPTTTGRKQLFAVSNIPTDRLNGITVGMSLDAARKVLQNVTSMADLTHENAFWITNMEEAPVITVGNYSESEVNSDPTKNNFTIEVGRACAKVNLVVDANVTQNGGTLDQSSMKYRVCNNPKRMYTLPTYMAGHPDQPISPYFNLGWATTETTQGIDTGTGEMGTLVHKVSYFDNGAPEDGVGNPTFTNLGTPDYMMENSNSEVLNSKATYLSIQGKWTPNADQLKNADGTTEGTTLGSSGDFWRIAAVENKGTADEKITGWEPGIYVAMPTVGIADDAKHKTYKYEGGICHYAMWVADNRIPESAKKYAVRRNHYYYVNITDVKGPGYSSESEVIQGPTPVEKDAYMKAKIQVLNWTVVDQGGGI